MWDFWRNLAYWEAERYKRILRESLKKEIPRILREEDLLSNPKKSYRVRIQELDDPKFLKAKPGGGGAGGGSGRGHGGDSEHGIEVELSLEELEELIWEHLRLPRLRPREGEDSDPISKPYGITSRGPLSRVHKTRTLKESLKSGGVLHPEVFRYREYREIRKPAYRAHVILARDCSGSIMDQDVVKIRSVAWWTLRWLRLTYPEIRLTFLLHDTKAWETDESTFFKTSSGGGTVCSSVIKLANKVVRSYPEDVDHYLLYYGDGENDPSDAEEFSRSVIELAPEVRLIAYGEIKRPYSTYFASISSYIPKLENVKSYPLENIAQWIKSVFGGEGEIDDE